MKKMPKLINLFAAVMFGVAGLVIASPANAVDYIEPSKICIPMQPAELLKTESNAELSKAVVDIMNEATATSKDQAVIDDRRVAWIWATEAKVACGKAYGYLRANYRDTQTINQCECFFRRMQHFLY